MSVGEILNHYDSDKKYPGLINYSIIYIKIVFGFGAKIPPNNQVSHCFPINFNWQNPEVHGVNGILQAYDYCMQHIT